MELHKLVKSVVVKFLIASIFAAALTGGFFYTYIQSQQTKNEVKELKAKQQEIENNLPQSLFEDHIKVQQAELAEFKLGVLQNELDLLKTKETSGDQQKITSVFNLLDEYHLKLSRNESAKLDVGDSKEKISSWGQKVLEKDFDTVIKEVSEEIALLETKYKEYLATVPPAPVSSEGYSYSTVKTEKGTHGVYLIKTALNRVSVKTVSASSGNCSNNCPTKSLADYVKDNGGYAGINGSYFCPPDYADCAKKVNSFDYAFYDSQDKKWINKDALTWFKTGLFTFKGTSASFHRKSSDFGGGSVDAAISNYPSLVKDGDVVVKSSELTSYQKVKGTRGALGTGDGNIYLAIISNATVEEAAYVMKSVGAQNALNLDGGGSSAMYVNGGYVVGPGRSLPNAVVLVK